jgi:hypothetical protein
MYIVDKFAKNYSLESWFKEAWAVGTWMIDFMRDFLQAPMIVWRCSIPNLLIQNWMSCVRLELSVAPLKMGLINTLSTRICSRLVGFTRVLMQVHCRHKDNVIFSYCLVSPTTLHHEEHHWQWNAWVEIIMHAYN